MVAYLEKLEGSVGFHQIIDFLTASHIKNSLTECLILYTSPIEQFWQTAALSTNEDEVRGITATIDKKVKVFVFEASIRRHLKLEDSKGLKTLPTIEIFEQLALMRSSDLTVQEAESLELDEREEVAAKVNQAHDIDWSDPAVLRYHTLQNRPFYMAEVRKNMCLYRRIKEVIKRYMGGGFDLQQESSKPVEEEIVQQDDVIVEQAVKESYRTAGGRRKKLLARKRAKETLSEESAKKQKLEDDTEKEELQVYLNIILQEESLNIESLVTKQDVLELYRLVKDRFQTASPEGYDLLLWGDLKTLIEPNEEDEIWRNQQDWNLINWKLHNFCGVHMESSSTREYPSLINTFFVTHTVGGVFVWDEGRALYDEMLRLQRLGSNTETGVPYTEEEIMAIVRKGKQRGHLPGVGRVLPGRATDGCPPPPQSTVDPTDVEKLKKSNKNLTKQVKIMMRLFRSDKKFSQMLTQFEPSPEFGGASRSGGCRDDEPGDDEDGDEDEEDGDS
ncbi:hypothetical protein Tco_0221512 [Tanacetum coccineum]